MAGGHNLGAKMADHGIFEMLDPGDGENIFIDSGKTVIGIVTEGASETNNLYPPRGIGWELTLQHRTDGGSRIISFVKLDGTTELAFQEDNDHKITLTDVDEAVGLVSVYNGTDSTDPYRWQVSWNNGTTLGT